MTKLNKYFNQKSKLTLKNKKYLQQVKWLADFMLREDLDKAGDITSNVIIKNNPRAKAVIIAKQTGIIAGLEEIRWLLKKSKIPAYSPRVEAGRRGRQDTRYKNDGDSIKKGQEILSMKGGIKDILKTERTILNILQRMSGIATETNKLAKLCPNVLICPTRKTQWGLLDKKAITVGGGGTHRLGLYDWVLVKDNHLKISDFKFSTPQRDPVFAAGQISDFFEVEVKNKNEALRATKLNPGAIMFDNMKPKQIKNIIKILKKYKPNTIFEASGGINEKNIREYAKTGVDIISLGYLTHSAKALDLSLDIIMCKM